MRLLRRHQKPKFLIFLKAGPKIPKPHCMKKPGVSMNFEFILF
jgi:hypothetical protein